MTVSGPNWARCAVRKPNRQARATSSARSATGPSWTTLTEGYYEVDLAGNFTFFNAAMSRMLGYAPSKLVGMNYRAYLDGEDAKEGLRGLHPRVPDRRAGKGFRLRAHPQRRLPCPHRGVGLADPGQERTARGLPGACPRYHRPKARRGGPAQERAEIPPDRREHPRHLLPVRPRGQARHGEPVRPDQDGL